MTTMNLGIEMLLARMDSHPQEFSDDVMRGRYGRWTSVIDQVRDIGSSFTSEERTAINNKLRDFERERFTQQVMKKLLDGPESGDWTRLTITAAKQGVAAANLQQQLAKQQMAKQQMAKQQFETYLREFGVRDAARLHK
jgi:hypothetical protein